MDSQPSCPAGRFAFPADHGPHPEFRIEWWYVTANLKDASGTAYGAQWTLFRQATRPGAQQQGWANQQIWMGHAAVTTADTHRYSEAFARGGVGQAGVETKPFHAWIDAWEMRGLDGMRDAMLAPLDLTASGADFCYALRLDADRPLVLQGDAGYSRKSERGQASYYYSQPFFKATGRITIDDKPVEVTGLAWMDREWSSQPLAPDQTGWDWFSLHLNSGEKLMLYRLRQQDGRNDLFGNWIDARRPLRRNRLSRQQHHADRHDRRRRPQGADRMARRHSRPRPCDRNHGAECRELDGHELSLLGGPDQFCGQPCRIRISGDDRVLRPASSLRFSNEDFYDVPLHRARHLPRYPVLLLHHHPGVEGARQVRRQGAGDLAMTPTVANSTNNIKF